MRRNIVPTEGWEVERTDNTFRNKTRLKLFSSSFHHTELMIFIIYVLSSPGNRRMLWGGGVPPGGQVVELHIKWLRVLDFGASKH